MVWCEWVLRLRLCADDDKPAVQPHKHSHISDDDMTVVGASGSICEEANTIEDTLHYNNNSMIVCYFARNSIGWLHHRGMTVFNARNPRNREKKQSRKLKTKMDCLKNWIVALLPSQVPSAPPKEYISILAATRWPCHHAIEHFIPTRVVC